MGSRGSKGDVIKNDKGIVCKFMELSGVLYLHTSHRGREKESVCDTKIKFATVVDGHKKYIQFH